MANLNKIKENNNPKFCVDIKKVRRVMVYAQVTNQFFEIKKKDILRDAENHEIHYYLSKDIFEVEQLAMVII